MNLREFIEDSRKRTYPSRAHLNEPGFRLPVGALYVRYTRRYILGEMKYPVLDLATVEAEKKGHGTWTRLIDRIRSEYPELHIFVESVLNERFVKKLESMGFQNLGPDGTPCFYLPPVGAKADPSLG